jgi:glutamate synthase domain-containing protein 2/rubredoxin
MAVYVCDVCEYEYDEQQEGKTGQGIPDGWLCPVCESDKSHFNPLGEAPSGAQHVEQVPPSGTAAGEYVRSSDDVEVYMSDIHRMAESGESIIEPMRARKPTVCWEDILLKGAQLTRLPLNRSDPVSTVTVIGPNATSPLIIDTPIFVTHMSYGALSKEIKLALAKGSAVVKTAMASGEGGILPESLEAAHRYIFEYVPNKYSVTEENLKSVDAIEIKIGQSAKPGMGGHLPKEKVTKEIAAVRGVTEGSDVISPSHFPDILTKDDLKRTVDWLREESQGRPIGIKLAAGDIEGDLDVALYAGPDFVTVDGRFGASGAAPKFVKAATAVPTVFALHRARKFLDKRGADSVSLIVTGGLRISSDFAKALAMGADAIAIGTAALMAAGCQQYRVCDTGKCPRGIATQDPDLRARLDVEDSARRLANYLTVSTEELADFARLTGRDDVHKLSVGDLVTTSSEISVHTDIQHA